MFAGDIAAALARLVSDLPLLPRVFGLLAASAGLSVNFCKTVIVNYGERSDFTLERRLVEATGIAQIEVSRFGTYLGVIVGLEAAPRFWNSALAKFAHRCALIRTSPAPLRQRIVAYRVHAVSVLQYLSQMADLPRVVDVTEAATLASIASAPIHAISAAAFARLRGVGASLGFASVRATSRAASFRAALRLDTLAEIGNTLEADAEDLDALLVRRSAAWERCCVLSFMLRTRGEALRLPARGSRGARSSKADCALLGRGEFQPGHARMGTPASGPPCAGTDRRRGCRSDLEALPMGVQ